jgi:hypothetical protein
MNFPRPQYTSISSEIFCASIFCAHYSEVKVLQKYTVFLLLLLTIREKRQPRVLSLLLCLFCEFHLPCLFHLVVLRLGHILASNCDLCLDTYLT